MEKLNDTVGRERGGNDSSTPPPPVAGDSVGNDEEYGSDFETDPTNPDPKPSSHSTKSPSASSISSSSSSSSHHSVASSSHHSVEADQNLKSNRSSTSNRRSRSGSEASVSGTSVSKHESQTKLSPRDSEIQSSRVTGDTTPTDESKQTHGTDRNGDMSPSPRNDAELKKYLQGVVERASEFYLNETNQQQIRSTTNEEPPSGDKTMRKESHDRDKESHDMEDKEVDNEDVRPPDDGGRSQSDETRSISQTSSSCSSLEKLIPAGSDESGDESGSPGEIENGRVSRFGMRPETENETSKFGNQTSSGNDVDTESNTEDETEKNRAKDMELENGNQSTELRRRSETADLVNRNQTENENQTAEPSENKNQTTELENGIQSVKPVESSNSRHFLKKQRNMDSQSVSSNASSLSSASSKESISSCSSNKQHHKMKGELEHTAAATAASNVGVGPQENRNEDPQQQQQHQSLLAPPILTEGTPTKVPSDHSVVVTGAQNGSSEYGNETDSHSANNQRAPNNLPKVGVVNSFCLLP